MNLLAPFYRLYEWKLYRQIKHNIPPRHVGVILDGN
ncbi:MAG: polyprenyl diphosphate synthase, partial [Candidatus Ranarchaeia archaeon]